MVLDQVALFEVEMALEGKASHFVFSFKLCARTHMITCIQGLTLIPRVLNTSVVPSKMHFLFMSSIK